jgi:hypothetical protein
MKDAESLGAELGIRASRAASSHRSVSTRSLWPKWPRFADGIVAWFRETHMSQGRLASGNPDLRNGRAKTRHASAVPRDDSGVILGRSLFEGQSSLHAENAVTITKS